MSQSILKTAGSGEGVAAAPRTVRLADTHTAHAAHDEQSAHEPAARSRPGAHLPPTSVPGRSGRASADLSGTMSAASVRLGGRNLKADAKQLVAFSGAVQQQMDLFGDGHPQGGKIAISYAQACNALAKECLAQNMLRTSHQLLGQAMHFLQVNHSFLVFGEQQRVLAEAYNNLGCLENKRGNLEAARKHLLQAVDIEAKIEWEVGHAATLINTCSTLSLLDKHDEALEAAKHAVDMLVANDKNWDQKAADPNSEEGELMPVAFNNLALEFEFAGERQQAQQAYEYAVMLATRRWGDSDARTAAIKETAWEADQALTLGQFRVRPKLKPPPKSSAEERRTTIRGANKDRNLDPKTRALLAATGAKGVKPPKKAELAFIYAETNNPIHRAADQMAGFHSPRFWAIRDGMAPRRASSFNKDLKQIGLEMARKDGAQQFPNSIQKTPWGESRVVWQDLPAADLSKIDGSVMSRTRVFSDVCGNTALETASKLLEQRQQRSKKFPRDVVVYDKAVGLRDSLRQSAGSLGSLPGLR